MIVETLERIWFTLEERRKLIGIAEGANKYTHPTSHPASIIIFKDGKTLQAFIDSGGTVGGPFTATDVSANNVVMAGNYVSSDRFAGRSNNERFYVGSSTGTRIDVTGGVIRLFASPLGSNDDGLMINTDGSVQIKSNSVNRHIFNANGSKTGGTIEVGADILGMSPTDSPQTLIEYLEYNIEINGEKVIELDPYYKQIVSKYAVFASNPDIKVIKKTKDSFKVQGTGVTDFEIKGQRIDAPEYFRLMGGLNHGVGEEETI